MEACTEALPPVKDASKASIHIGAELHVNDEAIMAEVREHQPDQWKELCLTIEAHLDFRLTSPYFNEIPGHETIPTEYLKGYLEVTCDDDIPRYILGLQQSPIKWKAAAEKGIRKTLKEYLRGDDEGSIGSESGSHNDATDAKSSKTGSIQTGSGNVSANTSDVAPHSQD